MPLPHKMKRNEFIRLAFLSSTAIYLNSCGSGKEKKGTEPPVQDSLPKDTIAKEPIVTTAEPGFTMYRKADEPYDILRKGFNKRIEKYPAVIAACTTTEEVSNAVAYGIGNRLPISVKSGGHSFEGFSSNNDGLEINMALMNKVDWESDSVINVGPGCKLSQLYDAILPKNKLLAAGSCGGVGLAGLTLGGGYGLFGRKYGLTCDSLLEVTMVDGKGNIINSKDDPELLWACKGGGNGNFGVITSMKFSLNEAPSFLQSYRFKVKKIDVPRAAAILEKWFLLSANLPLSCFSAFVLNGKSLYILLTNSEKSSAEIDSIINELSSIVDTTSKGNPQPLSKAVKVFYGQSAPTYFKNASAGLYNNFEDIKGCISQVLEKVTSTPGMIYQVNTLGGNINGPRLNEQSAYPHRDKNYLSELQTYWSQPSQGTRLINAFEEVQQVFYNHGIRSHYRNYPDINFKDWQDAYYGKNYTRLQATKKKYDPENIFSFEQSVKA